MSKDDTQSLQRIREQEKQELKKRNTRLRKAVDLYSSQDHKEYLQAQIKAITEELAKYRKFSWYCQGKELSPEQELSLQEGLKTKNKSEGLENHGGKKKKKKRSSVSVRAWRGGRADGNSK